MTERIEWGGTPGPWRMDKSGYIVDAGDDIICAFFSGGHFDDADLRAIVEVPAMVQALRYALQTARIGQEMGEPAMDRIQAILDRIDGKEVES